ncbi:class I adenylate-forming enzyme family protein [Kribbella sp. NPDC051587]|uniref:class I adenylate-forming enzyme family protein n=1 Tax=Kribbella sp. NPDC051587 TaxID=3364119 RepID=UPI0037A98C70
MMNIVDLVLEHTGDSRPAFIDEAGRATSYAEFTDLIRSLSTGLAATITETRQCLVVAHSELLVCVALTLAGWRNGLRVAVVPPYIKPGELAHVLEKCGPGIVVGQDADASGRVAVRDLLGASRSGGIAPLGEPWLETFTSGTTGKPKCVSRTVERLSRDVLTLAEVTGFGSADRITAMTSALSTTSVLPALVAGSALVQVGVRSGRDFWRQIVDRHVSVISGTPYAYEIGAQHIPVAEEIRDVRLALCTSARLRPRTARQMIAKGVTVRNVMCSSEAGHIAYNDSADSDILSRSVGRLLDGVEVVIREPVSGEPVRPGGTGLISVRSPYIATRYRNDVERSAEVFRNGWVLSTDVGHIHDGFLFLEGRDDHKIHVGAAKVDPQEIEDALLRHPTVLDCVVVGEPHPRLGQVIVARVKVAATVSSKELSDHCAQMLSSIKVPRKVEFVDEIPRDFKGQPVRPKFVRFDGEE